jgi:hypothetical protein
MAEPFRILTLNNISTAAWSACPATATRSPPTSTARTRSCCARRTCTPTRCRNRCSRSHVPAPARTTSRSRRSPRRGVPGVQHAGRQRQRGEGTRARRPADRGAQPRRRVAVRRGLSGDDAAIDAATEKGKKHFVGFELPGRTLGVVGLGAIGVAVAEQRASLGMNVLGYDPQITVERAWSLPRERAAGAVARRPVRSARRFRRRARAADARDAQGSSMRQRLALMRRGGVLLNFARAASSTTRPCSRRSTPGSCTPTSAISRRTRSRTPARRDAAAPRARRPGRPRTTAR